MGLKGPTGQMLFGRFAQRLSGLKEILLGVAQILRKKKVNN